jgi:type IV pilus assembly protein PilV
MKKDQGFTFIEIMVCVLILSVGLLGLMALQAMSLRNNLGSYYRVQANLLAHNIADRIRLNFVADPAAFEDALKENDRAINQYLLAPFIPPVAWDDPNCSAAVGCDRKQMARNDIYEWKTAIRDILPVGQARVNCQRTIAAGGPVCTAPYSTVTDLFIVTISWDDNRNNIVDNRDNITPANSCFLTLTLAQTSKPVLPNPQPFQFDPCFKMDFKL